MKEWCLVFAALAAALAVLHLLGVTCLIKFTTGISCPGCGMTRAWLAFLTGHPGKAFSYHPLFLIVVPAAAYLVVRVFLVRRGVRREMIRRADRAVLAAVSLALFVCYGIRLADPADTVVVCHPREGVLYRLLSWLTTR